MPLQAQMEGRKIAAVEAKNVEEGEIEGHKNETLNGKKGLFK